MKERLPGRTVPQVLELLNTFVLPATTVDFVAVSYFRSNSDSNTKVIIKKMNPNFQAWFLEGEGKIEKPRPESFFRCCGLAGPAFSSDIVTELGGVAENLTTGLAEIFALMERHESLQPPEKNLLLVNGESNVFFAIDCQGKPRLVSVSRDASDGSYTIDAFSIEDLRQRYGNRRFFYPV